jgi:hypothetical protein
VVKKGELREGDLCVYFEIDSILPSTDRRFAFMEPRKYRVRTIKLRKQISQGLAMPLSEFPELVPEEGRDVTRELDVRKHDPQEALERAYTRTPRKELWYYKLPFGRLIGRLLDPHRGAQFPPFIPKTDETRVQNIGNIKAHLHFPTHIYLTEKLDGMSVSIFYKKEPWYRKDIRGIASRNVWRHQVGGAWWAAGGPILRKLEEYCRERNLSLAIQGEIVGPGIQGNRYKLPSLRVFVFNIFDIDKQQYVPLETKMAILLKLREQHVPFLGTRPYAYMEISSWLEMAEDVSSLNPDVQREGIVVRSLDDDARSFKAISNKYLLEAEE